MALNKVALNAVASSNTTASISNILPSGFVVHFVVDRLEKSGIDSCVVALSFHIRFQES